MTEARRGPRSLDIIRQSKGFGSDCVLHFNSMIATWNSVQRVYLFVRFLQKCTSAQTIVPFCLVSHSPLGYRQIQYSLSERWTPLLGHARFVQPARPMPFLFVSSAISKFNEEISQSATQFHPFCPHKSKSFEILCRRALKVKTGF